MGRPCVALDELLKPSACFGRTGVQLVGLTGDEISELLVEGPLRAGVVEVTTVNWTWPMGVGWSF